MRVSVVCMCLTGQSVKIKEKVLQRKGVVSTTRRGFLQNTFVMFILSLGKSQGREQKGGLLTNRLKITTKHSLNPTNHPVTTHALGDRGYTHTHLKFIYTHVSCVTANFSRWPCRLVKLNVIPYTHTHTLTQTHTSCLVVYVRQISTPHGTHTNLRTFILSHTHTLTHTQCPSCWHCCLIFHYMQG